MKKILLMLMMTGLVSGCSYRPDPLPTTTIVNGIVSILIVNIVVIWPFQRRKNA